MMNNTCNVPHLFPFHLLYLLLHFPNLKKLFSAKFYGFEFRLKKSNPIQLPYKFEKIVSRKLESAIIRFYRARRDIRKSSMMTSDFLW